MQVSCLLAVVVVSLVLLNSCTDAHSQLERETRHDVLLRKADLPVSRSTKSLRLVGTEPLQEVVQRPENQNAPRGQDCREWLSPYLSCTTKTNILLLAAGGAVLCALFNCARGDKEPSQPGGE